MACDVTLECFEGQIFYAQVSRQFCRLLNYIKKHANFYRISEIAGHYGLVTQHLIERGYAVDSW